MPLDVAKFVNWVWDNRQANGKQDQIEDLKPDLYPDHREQGLPHHCIRWQSATKLTQTYRDKNHGDTARARSRTWTDYLKGFEN